MEIINHKDKYYIKTETGYREVLATTDESLEPINLYGNSGLFKTKLPKPSDSFISKYIEEYNKGNIITKVLVEYEPCKICKGGKRHVVAMFGEVDCNYCQKNEGYEKLYIEPKLKINSKDNTITIKKVKDSYSREEVYTLLYNAIGYGASLGETIETKDIDKWIEENL